MTRIGGRRWLGISRATWAEIGADRTSIVASGVAFRVALALFPAVALVVWAASRAVGPGEGGRHGAGEHGRDPHGGGQRPRHPRSPSSPEHG